MENAIAEDLLLNSRDTEVVNTEGCYKAAHITLAFQSNITSFSLKENNLILVAVLTLLTLAVKLVSASYRSITM